MIARFSSYFTLFSDSSDTLSVLSVCVLPCPEKWPFFGGFFTRQNSFRVTASFATFFRGVFLVAFFRVTFFAWRYSHDIVRTGFPATPIRDAEELRSWRAPLLRSLFRLPSCPFPNLFGAFTASLPDRHRRTRAAALRLLLSPSLVRDCALAYFCSPACSPACSAGLFQNAR